MTVVTLPGLNETPERPICLACNHGTPPGALLCPLCVRRLDELLGAIPAGFHRLDVRPGGTGPDGGRAPAGFGSRPPLRVDVLSLVVAPAHAVTARPLVVDDEPPTRDERALDGVPRADPDTPRNARAQHPVVVAVGQWADRAREHGLLDELHGPRTVAGECLRLGGIVEQLTRQWWVGDMVRDLARTEHVLRRALGEAEAPALPIGWCPRIRDAHLDRYELLVDELGRRLADMAADAQGWRCGGAVRARLTADHASCTRCRQQWRGEQTLERLGVQLGGAMLDLAGLVRYLDDPSLTAAGLRQWAHRDGWRRERIGRRTVYALADARDSWWARRGVRGVAVDGRERIGA